MTEENQESLPNFAKELATEENILALASRLGSVTESIEDIPGSIEFLGRCTLAKAFVVHSKNPAGEIETTFNKTTFEAVYQYLLDSQNA
jgi:hypothetical protein